MKDFGWIPFGLRWQDETPEVDWCRLGNLPLTEPFFDQNIQKALTTNRGEAAYRSTSIKALQELPATDAELRPSGFIFHTSRCGSTLVTRMLSCVAANIVIVEPNIVESIIGLSRSSKISVDTAAELLRGVVLGFGQLRPGNERHLIIKFNSRHILDFPVIRLAFPDVPWVFLYRKPYEVMSSLLRGSQSTVPPGLLESGIAGSNLTAEEVLFLRSNPARFWAKVLELCCDAALKNQNHGSSLFLNYNQLPEAVYRVMAKFFDLSLTSGDIESMRTAAIYHPKKSSVVFTGDAQTDPATSEAIHEAIASRVEPLYQKLESTRQLKAC